MSDLLRFSLYFVLAGGGLKKNCLKHFSARVEVMMEMNDQPSMRAWTSWLECPRALEYF